MTTQSPSSNDVAKLKKWWSSKTTQVVTMVLVVALAVYIVSRTIKPEEF